MPCMAARVFYLERGLCQVPLPSAPCTPSSASDIRQRLGQPQWRNALNISKNHDSSGGRGGGSEAKSPAFCNGRHMAKKAQIQSARPLRMIVEWASIYIRYDVNIKSVTCSATCRAGERRPYKSFSARAIILRWILNAQFCLLTFKI